MQPPPVPQQEGDGSAPVTPTTPTTPITPTAHAGQPGMQPGRVFFDDALQVHTNFVVDSS